MDFTLRIFFNDNMIYLKVYVDNILIMGRNLTLVQSLNGKLKAPLTIQDLKDLNLFLDR